MCTLNFFSKIVSRATWRLTMALAVCSALATFSPVARAETAGRDLNALNPEQAELAKRMVGFVKDMETKHFDLIKRLNGKVDADSKVFEYESADYDVQVARGPVIEKAAFTLSITKKGIPPYTTDAAWSHVISINVHPKTPLVGYLHTFVSFQYDVEGKSLVGGWMDVVPGVRIEEDLAYIKQRVDRVFEKYGFNADPYRRAVCSGQRQKNLFPACVGASFFAPPFLKITEQNFNVVTETLVALFDAYSVVLEKRKDQKFSADDLAAQEAMRRRWLEDQMLHDPYAQHVIPHEVRSFQNYPPVVKY
jgi:coproporphyrinogen III oxidase